MRAERVIRICLTFCVMLETMTMILAQKTEDSIPVALEQSDETSEYYAHKGLSCKKCPPGHYVFKHCERSGTEGVCLPCGNHSFAKYLNSLDKCLFCSDCRAIDQVEVQPCTPTSDVQCACKNGTFCSPDFPCEACHKCTTRCPDGEIMVQPCTPESDIQCTKTLDPPDTHPSQPPVAGSSGHTALIVAGLLIVALAFCAVVYMRKRKCCTRASTTGSAASTWSSKTVQGLWRKCSQRQQEEQDNLTNVQVDDARSSARNSEIIPLEMANSSEKDDPVVATGKRRNLVLANGKERISTLRQSFEIFICKVPMREWKRFMRALGLTDNNIECSVANHITDVKEQNFQMLQTWLDKNGMEASVNTLLEMLCNLDLSGVEEEIRTALLSRGWYVYEVNSIARQGCLFAGPLFETSECFQGEGESFILP